MKITCARKDLENGVRCVLQAVPTRTTMSILECILIDANGTNIKLTANDTEIGIETIINGIISESGVVAIDAKELNGFVTNIPDDDITLETTSNNEYIIHGTKRKFKGSWKSAEDFAMIPSVARNQPIEVSQLTLKETINQTIFSIADNDNNKMMTGELFEINGSNLRVVALDGHRISIRNIEMKQSYESNKIIIPGKNLNKLSKILGSSADEMVSIFISDNYVTFIFNNTTVVSRLIEGEFFKIDQMLSSDYQTKLKVNRAALTSSINAATLLTSEGNKKPIIMDIKDDTMFISLSSTKNDMNDEIEIYKEGNDIMIGFNPKFFNDALRAITDEEITVYMMNPKAPCYIKDEAESYIYIILPVNFNVVNR